MGLESGDDDLLKKVGKTENSSDMIKAVNLAQECGFKVSVMVLLGLAGKKGSRRHAELTSEVLNCMQPRLLSFLRFVEVGNPLMFEGYEAVSEYEAVNELRNMIAQLELERTVFRANHSSNPFPLEGRFPQDKEKLLAEVSQMLESGKLDTKEPGFTPMFL